MTAHLTELSLRRYDESWCTSSYLLLLLAAFLVSSCASTPGEFRSFSPLSSPTDSTSPTGSKNVTHKIRGATLTEKCINKVQKDGALEAVCEESVLYEDQENTLGDAFGTCSKELYLCKNDRDNFIDLAVRVADNNCNEFRERLFAKRAGAGVVTGLLRDSTSVGGAATAVGSPATSIGMSLGGLLIGSYEKISQDLFSNKTAQIFDKAIAQSTTRYYESLNTTCRTKEYNDCSIHRAVNLVKQYAGMCSIRAALLTIEESLQIDKLATDRAKEVAEKTAKEITTQSLEKVAQEAVNKAATNTVATINQQTEASVKNTEGIANNAQKVANDAQAAAQRINQKLQSLCNTLKSASGVAANIGVDSCP